VGKINVYDRIIIENQKTRKNMEIKETTEGVVFMGHPVVQIGVTRAGEIRITSFRMLWGTCRKQPVM